jgi:hypothetical protein
MAVVKKKAKAAKSALGNAESLWGKRGGQVLSILHKRAKAEGKGRNSGRQKGTPNKITRLLKEAIPEALERLGSDGKGKDGIVGFLMVAAVTETAAYLRLLDRLLPYQITGLDGGDVKLKYTNKVEIVARLKERGLPIPPSLIDNDISDSKTIEGKAVRNENGGGE